MWSCVKDIFVKTSFLCMDQNGDKNITWVIEGQPVL